MSFSKGEDKRFLFWLVTGASALLAGALFFSLFHEDDEWRAWQESFVSEHGGEAPGVLERERADGGVERCETCHLGVRRAELSLENVPLPARGHSPLGLRHLEAGVACTSCHGGRGLALKQADAHLQAKGEAIEPRMKSPWVEASCIRCHTPGGEGSERLASGAQYYAELGCGVCHGFPGVRGSHGQGPSLWLRPASTPSALEESLLTPAKDDPETTMPSFAPILSHSDEAKEDLLIYLLALEGWGGETGRSRERRVKELDCVQCHRGELSQQSFHQCVWIEQRREQWSCLGCHRAGWLREATGTCVIMEQEEANCGLCHQ